MKEPYEREVHNPKLLLVTEKKFREQCINTWMLELLSAFLSVSASAHEMLMLTFRVSTLIWRNNINKIPPSHTQSSAYVRWSHSETPFSGDSILCQLHNQNCPLHLPINKGNILIMHKTRATDEKTASLTTINYGINNCMCTYKDRQLLKQPIICFVMKLDRQSSFAHLSFQQLWLSDRNKIST